MSILPVIETDLKQKALETTKTIKIALMDRGWTQKHLAELMKENVSEVNRAIKGDMTPKSKEIRKKIYEVLNIK